MPNDDHRADPDMERALAEQAAEENARSAASDAAASMEQAVASKGETIGVRARKAFTLRDFIPNRDPDWIMKNVVAKGRGAMARMGRVYGTVHSVERTENEWQGKKLSSCRLDGVFETVNFETGEVMNTVTLYLPDAFASQIEAAFRQGASRVEMDIDVGCESTGKPIPYEWVVISYMDGEARRALRDLRNRRPTALTQNALKRLGHDTTAQGNA